MGLKKMKIVFALDHSLLDPINKDLFELYSVPPQLLPVHLPTIFRGLFYRLKRNEIDLVYLFREGEDIHLWKTYLQSWGIRAPMYLQQKMKFSYFLDYVFEKDSLYYFIQLYNDKDGVLYYAPRLWKCISE